MAYASKFTAKGITYSGCVHYSSTWNTYNTYFCKTTDGAVITSDTVLSKAAVWNSAKRYIKFNYNSGDNITWHQTSAGTGNTGPVHKDTDYWLCYYHTDDSGDEPTHPFCLSTGQGNTVDATGWITREEFLRGCPAATIYFYKNSTAATGTDEHPLSTSDSNRSATTAKVTGSAQNIYNVTTLFKRTGYGAVSNAQAWRLGSSTSTTYVNQKSHTFSAVNYGEKIKLYANWAAKTTYTMTYKPGSGSGTNYTNDRVIDDDDYKVAKNKFTAPSSTSTSYTITLKNYDGSSIGTKTCNKTTSYSFKNWLASNGSYYKPGDVYTTNGNTTFTAQWKSTGTPEKISLGAATRSTVTQNAYTVQFNSNGGTSTPAAITSQKVLTYPFSHWTNTSNTSDTTQYKSDQTYGFSANTTLKAVYGSATTAYGSIVLPSVSHSTKTFLGWNDGTNTYAAGAPYTPKSNITLTAQWQDPTSYSITYTADASYNSSGFLSGYEIPVSQGNITPGSTVTISTKVPHCYKWALRYWEDQDGNRYNPGDSITVNKNIILSYKGHSSSNTNPQSAMNGDILYKGKCSTFSITPSVSGYYCYYTYCYKDYGYDYKAYLFDSNGQQIDYNQDQKSTKYGFPETILGKYDTVLLSYLTAGKTYYIALLPEGSTATSVSSGYAYGRKGYAIPVSYVTEDETNVSNMPTIVTSGNSTTPFNAFKLYNLTYILPSTIPSRSGYEFSGWKYNNTIYQPGGSFTENLEIGNEITFEAVWTSTEFPIYYHPGSYVSGSTVTDIKTKNIDKAIEGALFTRTGYEQIGWASDQAGTTHAYNFGDMYTLNQELHLYPEWEREKYIITYKPGSYGNEEESIQEKEYNITATIAEALFTREGYEQTGWSTSDGGSVSYSFGQSYTANAALTLYPVWTQTTTNINQYTLYVGSYVDISIPAATTQGYPSTNWDTVVSNGGFALITIEGVDSSGTYKFYSTNNSGDPCANLIDSGANFIVQDDQSGGSSNFSIERSLTAGDYYLIVKEWTQGRSGTLRVYAEGPPPVSSGYEELEVNGSPKVARLKVTTSAGNANVTKDDNNVVVYKITNITTTGTHTFYSAYYNTSGPDPLASLWQVSGSTWTHLQKADGGGDTSQGVHNFKIEYNITDLSKEYYLCVRNYNSANGTEGDVYVYATGPATVTNYTIYYYAGSYGSGTAFSETSNGTTFTTESAGYFTSTRSNYTQTGWSTSSDGSSKDYELNTTYSISGTLYLYPYWEYTGISSTNLEVNGPSVYTYLNATTDTDTSKVPYNGNNVKLFKITNITTTGGHTFESLDYSNSSVDPLGSLWKYNGSTWEHLKREDGGGSSSYGISHFKITYDITDLTAEYYLAVRCYGGTNYNQPGGIYVKATGPATVTNYTMTYLPGSGSGTSFTQSVEPGTYYTLPEGDVFTPPASTVLSTTTIKLYQNYGSNSYTTTTSKKIKKYTLYAWNDGTTLYSLGINMYANASKTYTAYYEYFEDYEYATLPTLTRSSEQITLYTVSFNGNGVTNPDPQSTYKNVSYSHLGWNSGTSTTATSNPTYAAGISLYLANDSNLCAVWSTTTTSQKTSITLPSPTRSGYTLEGWYNGTTKVGNGGASYTPTDNITLKANWVENNPIYTISLNQQSGTGTSPTTIYLKYNNGWYSNYAATTSISSITTPTKTGYSFGGYYTQQNGNGTQIIYANGNIVSGRLTTFTANSTIYAYWIPNTVAISYRPYSTVTNTAYSASSEGSQIKEVSSNRTYFHNLSYGESSAPYKASEFGLSKPGYTFNGWLVEGTSNTILDENTSYPSTAYTAYDNSTKSTANATGVINVLAAQWTPIKYAINFSPGTGSGAMAAQEKTHGVAYTLPSCSFTSPSANVQNYTITLKNSDGTDYDTKTCTRTTPYVFNTWRLNSTSGDSYSVGSNYTTNAAATFYATWSTGTGSGSVSLGSIPNYSINQGYTVSFDGNGATNPASQSTTKKTDYTFKGWGTSQGTSTASYNSTSNYAFTSDKTLYAVWNSSTTGTSSITLPSITRTGYDFLGWYQLPTYNHSSISGATHGFTYNSSTQTFSNNNNGVSNSQAMCQININAPSACTLYVDVTHCGEGKYDYGTFSILNKTLPTGSTTPTEYHRIYNSTTSGVTTTETLTYSLPAGTSSFQVKFQKDGSVNKTNEGLSFKLRFSESAEKKVGDAGQSYTPTENITLKAKWQIKKYAINFNPGTGSGTMSAQEKTYGEAYTLPSCSFTAPPTETTNYSTKFYENNGTSNYQTVNGTISTTYSFNKWRLNSTSGTEYAVGNNYTTNAAATFYATWSSTTVKNNITFPAALSGSSTSRNIDITFDPNGGNINNTIRTGTKTTTYTFGKWKSRTTNTEYAAGYNSYAPADGEHFDATWTTSSVYSNVTAPTATECTRTGYNLVGWGAAADSTTSIVSPGNAYSTSNSTTTLYAIWEPKILTITLDRTPSTSGTSAIYLKYGVGWYSNSTATTSITQIGQSPSRTGYNFQGYYTEEAGAGTQIITYNRTINSGHLETFSENTTLYVKWNPNQQTIAYKGNGNTGGSTSNSILYYDTEGTLRQNGFTKAHTVSFNSNGGSSCNNQIATYTFKNWNRAADGTQQSYVDKAKLLNISTASETINLYAQWNPASIILPNSTKSGYVLEGWYKEIEITPTYTVSPVEGASYTFNKNPYTDYYVSNNSSIHYSAALCKITINTTEACKMYVDCINYGESNYDYGILSNLNETLGTSYNSSDSYKKSFSGSQSASIQTVEYDLPAGESFIYVKFRKDSSVSSYNDNLQFKLRFSNTTTSEEKVGNAGDTYTPEKDITLYAKWKSAGSVRVKTALGYILTMPYIYHNGSWQQATGYVHTNGDWEHGS